MVRTRSDAVFTKAWWPMTQMSQTIGPKSIGVAAVSIDAIWICGRDTSMSMMYLFPSLFYRPHRRSDVAAVEPSHAAVYGPNSIFPEAMINFWLSRNRDADKQNR